MELHRTETIINQAGALIPLIIIGVFPHEGDIRERVLQLKYEQNKSNAYLLASVVSPIIQSFNNVDVITWAPTSQAHLEKRGMDHAELIARHCAAQLKLPVRKLLRRLNEESQTGSTRQQRLVQPKFSAKPLRRFRQVVVIDDVVTTGSTFRAAADALSVAGALSVMCVAPSTTL